MTLLIRSDSTQLSTISPRYPHRFPLRRPRTARRASLPHSHCWSTARYATAIAVGLQHTYQSPAKQRRLCPRAYHTSRRTTILWWEDGSGFCSAHSLGLLPPGTTPQKPDSPYCCSPAADYLGQSSCRFPPARFPSVTIQHLPHSLTPILPTSPSPHVAHPWAQTEAVLDSSPCWHGSGLLDVTCIISLLFSSTLPCLFYIDFPLLPLAGG